MDAEKQDAERILQVSVSDITPTGCATVLIDQGDENVVTDRRNIAKEQKRNEFLDEMQERFGGLSHAEREAIDAHLRRSLQPSIRADKAVEQDPEALLSRMPERARQEADELLKDPMLLRQMLDDVAILGVAGERELVATLYLIGTSRLLERPLAAIVQGPSSSGKSHLIESVAKLFPPETVIHATQITPQALVHMKPGSLVHRFVVAGERSRLAKDEAAEATRALREMLSSGKLTKLMPGKVDGGRIETLTIEQDGPISYVESTTLTNLFEEDANRCLLLNTDERPAQNERVLRHLATDYTGRIRRADTGRIIERHWALQRMLKPLPIVVPYADKLASRFNSDRVEVRRAFARMISMVQASALLHQYQREQTDDGLLIARPEDYQLAYRLAAKPMARLLGGRMSDPACRFYQRLCGRVDGAFTTREAINSEQHQASDHTVRGWLNELGDAGIAEVVEAARGKRPAVWQLTGRSPDEQERDSSGLPAVGDMFPGQCSGDSDKAYPLVPKGDMPEKDAIAGNLQREY